MATEKATITSTNLPAYTPSEPGRESAVKPLREYHHRIPSESVIKNKIPREMHKNNVKPNSSEELTTSSIFDESFADRIGSMIKPIKEIFVNAGKTTKDISLDSGTVLTDFIKRLLTETTPGMMKARTWSFAGGAAIFTYKTIKSIFDTLRLFYGRVKGDFSPFVHLITALLNGGAAASFLSPFFSGLRNPAAVIKNGKLAIDPFRLGGVVAAPLVMESAMNVSKGESIFNKLFRIIGIDLTEVFKPPFDGVKWVTSAGADPSAGNNAQGAGAGAGGANPLAGLGGLG